MFIEKHLFIGLINEAIYFQPKVYFYKYFLRYKINKNLFNFVVLTFLKKHKYINKIP